MSKRNIETMWIDPDDAPALTAAWFAEATVCEGDKVVRPGRPRSESPKRAVSLRLDAAVLDWFRSTGAGWQTRINDELKKVAGL